MKKANKKGKRAADSFRLTIPYANMVANLRTW